MERSVYLNGAFLPEEMKAATEETLARNQARDEEDFAVWHVVARGDRADDGGTQPPNHRRVLRRLGFRCGSLSRRRSAGDAGPRRRASIPAARSRAA